MKIINFRGDLTDNSDKKEVLLATMAADFDAESMHIELKHLYGVIVTSSVQCFFC